MKKALVSESLQQKLYNTLAGAVLHGTYPPGSALPSVLALCREYHLSKTTVCAVLDRLKREKLIHPRVRRPALVAFPRRPQTRRNIRIGIVVCNDTSAFSYTCTSAFGWMLYRGVVCHAAKRGWPTTTFPNRFLDDSAGTDGFIVIGGDHSQYDRMMALGRPFVMLMSAPNIGRGAVVYLDRGQAMEQSALYFLSHGVKTVFTAGYGRDDALKHCREAHFDATLRNCGFPEEAFLHLADRSILEGDGERAMKQILSDRPELPLGLLPRGDYYARGMITAGLAAGLKPKQDFFVIGITDCEESARWKPPLTVQRCPYGELGTAAVSMLEQAVISGELQPTQYLPSELVIRKT